MDPVTIIALVTGLEQLIVTVLKIVNDSGLSADEKQAYIARIIAAQNSVPEPKVGLTNAL